MPKITALFIDDGGVMNNNALRGPEWRRLVAEFFPPILGGDRISWVEANRVVFGGLEQMLIDGPQGRDYAEWLDAYLLRWLRDMAAHAGADSPVDDAECIRLAWQASDYITPRVRSSYAGTADAIRALHGMGFTLFTASGEHSRELQGYLTGMGVREYFTCLYGADLIRTGKYSVEYYQRVFEHAGVAPIRALVIDDKPHNLAWAHSLGAVTCLADTSPEQGASADFTVQTLADLPSILR